MKNLSTIWERPVYLPNVQPTLTERAILETEMQIGYKLPVEFTNLLKTQNGGTTRCTLEHLPNHISIFGIGPNKESISNNIFQKWTPEGLIPFDGDCDFCLCMDYRENTNTPAITALHGKWNEDIFYTLEEQAIAENFNDYLSMLEVHASDTLVFETEMSIREAKAVISRVIQRKIRPASTMGGVVYYTTDLRNAKDYFSIDIYNNIVPKYYTLRDATQEEYQRDPLERKFEVIDKNYPNEFALRHPEVPAEFILLDFPVVSNVRLTFLEKMRKAGYTVRPLKHYLD